MLDLCFDSAEATFHSFLLPGARVPDTVHEPRFGMHPNRVLLIARLSKSMRLVSRLFFSHHAWLPGCSLGCREMGGVSGGRGETVHDAKGAQPKAKGGRDVASSPHSVPRDNALQNEGSRSPRCPPSH